MGAGLGLGLGLGLELGLELGLGLGLGLGWGGAYPVKDLGPLKEEDVPYSKHGLDRQGVGEDAWLGVGLGWRFRVRVRLRVCVR